MTIFSWTVIRNMDSLETLNDQKFHVKLLETHIKNGSRDKRVNALRPNHSHCGCSDQFE